MFDVWIVSERLEQIGEIQNKIEKEHDFSVTEVLLSFADAIEVAKYTQPDFILIDIDSFEDESVEITEAVSDIFLRTKIIALVTHEEPHVIINALIRGANWYIKANQRDGIICSVLRNINDGKASLSWKVASFFTEHLRLNHSCTSIYLTERERAILLDIEAGCTYQETADNLRVSIHTVHKQVKKIFKKLSVRKKRDALEAARKNNLL